MRAMPRALCRPRIPVTGVPAGPESRHPPDAAGTRGIARMARSYGDGCHRHVCRRSGTARIAYNRPASGDPTATAAGLKREAGDALAATPALPPQR